VKVGPLRAFSWAAIAAAALIAPLSCAVYSGDIEEAVALLARIDAAEPASVEEIFRGERREGEVKLEGIAGARQSLALPTQPARKVAYYELEIWHRYEDDDDEYQTDLEGRMTKTALEITRGSDLFVAVVGQPTYAYLKNYGHGDAEIVRTTEGYEARYGALSISFDREGGDELWVDEEWLEPGEPVFAVGRLIRGGDETKLVGAPDGWLLLSVHSGAETRALIARERDELAASYDRWLGAAGVLFALGLVGVISSKLGEIFRARRAARG
jgi:hypothetical protein